MAIAIKPLDPKKIIMNFGGVTIDGYAEGTYVNIELNEDVATKTHSTDGTQVALMKNQNFSGTVTFTVLQTALCNAGLTKLFLDFRSNFGTPGHDFTYQFSMKDSLGTDFAKGEGWIEKVSKIEESKTVTNREWKIYITDIDLEPGIAA
jgi:hypothetical protein